MPSPFPCSPVIREWLRKKTEIETKTLGNQTPVGSKYMFCVKEIFSALSFQACVFTENDAIVVAFLWIKRNFSEYFFHKKPLGGSF